ncbi:YdeI/OmpD-associated family protein [Microtetraspora malaysiensis]|uniref:YdeI/OmpD-associated family protein n=1 Tax=Microtetraspora malaysiensis TaxID=161358 RepID=UPI003D8E376D
MLRGMATASLRADDLEAAAGMILDFADAAAFESWLAAHHEEPGGAWLRIAKKGSGATSVTTAQALEVALCYGWIDSQRKGLDGTHFLQKYSRRRPRGTWSKVNVARVEALVAAGRMREPGLAEVAAARADGRWAAAYEPQRLADPPDDLLAALEAAPVAKARFDALGRTRRYGLILPLLKAATPEHRAALLTRTVTALAAD